MIEPYNVERAAELLHCSAYTVRELCKSGRIPGVKLGEDWIIPAGALFARLDQIALEESESRRTVKESPKAVLSQVKKSSSPRPALPSLSQVAQSV